MQFKDLHLKTGIVCPFCRNENGIEGDSVEINGNTACQEVSCVRCGGVWLDKYVLTDAETVCEPEEAIDSD